MENQPRSIKDIFEAMRQKLEAQSEALCEALDAAPLQRRCDRHPHISARLQRQKSEESGKVCYLCEECEAERQKNAIEARKSRIGVPSDAFNARFHNFRKKPKTSESSMSPQKFLDDCQAFERGEFRNLVLAGKVGIGKGHLTGAIIHERMEKGGDMATRMLWITTPTLFADYHRAYDDNSNQDYIRFLVSRNLLVIDECAIRDLPRDGEQILFEVIDGRQKRGAQTILLSNAYRDRLREWLGERVRDRLKSGGARFLWGDWESERGEDGDGANNNNWL